LISCIHSLPCKYVYHVSVNGLSRSETPSYHTTSKYRLWPRSQNLKMASNHANVIPKSHISNKAGT